MSYWYILDEDDNPVPVSMLEGARWLEENPERRVIKQETIYGHVFVSTVFLGLDHGWGTEEVPLVFETMVFPFHRSAEDPMLDYWQKRTSTKEEALKAHEEAMAWAEKHYGAWPRFVEEQTRGD